MRNQRKISVHNNYWIDRSPPADKPHRCRPENENKDLGSASGHQSDKNARIHEYMASSQQYVSESEKSEQLKHPVTGKD